MNSYFKAFICAVFCAACLFMTAGGAMAAKKAPKVKKGYWVFRARVIDVMPAVSSGEVGELADSAVDIGDARALELDFTYMLNPHFGFELILGTTEHEISGEGSLEGVTVGSTRVLPPTLTAQYHFLPDSFIRPYVGAGLNYTLFYASYASKELENALGDYNTSLSLSSSMGLAFQVGVDIALKKNFFINIDIKKIHMKSKATVETADNTREVDVDINPLVIGIGAGMVF